MSPGLEVMRGDSCKLFESQQHILDGHFLQILVVKIVRFVRKGKNKQKESGMAHFKNKETFYRTYQLRGEKKRLCFSPEKIVHFANV